jgi:hypothetical protein
MVAVLAMLMLMLMMMMLLLRGHCRRCCLDSCNTFTLSIMIVNQLDDDVAAAAAAVVVAAVAAGLVVGSINVEVISSCRNTDFIIREMSRLMRSSSPNVWREFLVPFTTTVP